MFSPVSLHVRRPRTMVIALAAVMVGLAAALPLLVVSTSSASDSSPVKPPGKVSGVAVSENQEPPGSISVTWDAATSGGSLITDYIILAINTDDETDYQVETVTTSGANPSPEELVCDVTGLISGDTYDVKVRARAITWHLGPWSDAVRITLSGD